MASKSLGYTGALNEPISPIINCRTGRKQHRLLILKGFDRYIINRWSAALTLLFAHYGIEPKEPECWPELAFHLALTYVPGMRIIDQPGRGKGAPTKRDHLRDQNIVEVIDEINRKRRGGIKDAIRIAQKRNQLNGNASGLERRYYALKETHRRLNDFRRRPPTVPQKLDAMYPSLIRVSRDRGTPEVIRFREVDRGTLDQRLVEQIRRDVEKALKKASALFKNRKA